MAAAASSARDRSRSPKGKADQEPVVPIIDISGLYGDKASMERVSKQIGEACEKIGFMVIVNHGVPQKVIDEAWNETLAFFDRPMSEKMLMKTADEEKYPYGYSALGGEVLSAGKALEKKDSAASESGSESKPAGDLKEMWAIGPDNGAMPERQWPKDPPAFAGAYAAYYAAINDLAGVLLKAFAVALDLPENWFDDKRDKHISALRANNYPDQSGMKVQDGSIRCSAHTDYGTITILKSGGPGLQVSKDKDSPVWHDVPFVKDAFIINLGDLMRRWTNDKWSSTLHRVVNPSANDRAAWGRRLSLAFFHNLNKDAQVEAIPSCVSEARPAIYDPIIAGDFLMLKHLASMGKADPDAHLKAKSGA